MRLLALGFVALIAALQYPLWLGKGGWLRAWDLDRQLAAQRSHNAQLQSRNDALEAEVRDLKSGYEAVEERARFELGMIRQDEVFFQFVKPEVLRQDGAASAPQGGAALPSAPAPAPGSAPAPGPASAPAPGSAPAAR